MKTFIFIYEGCVQFEVVLTALFMKGRSEIITVSYDKQPIHSGEGFKLIPHLSLDELNIDEVDLFVIPGGEPTPLIGRTELHEVVRELNRKEKVISAICGGPIALAEAGLLDDTYFTSNIHEQMPEPFKNGKLVDKDVVTDGNMITGRGKAYVEFAMEIGRKMNIFENAADEQETFAFFKNQI